MSRLPDTVVSCVVAAAFAACSDSAPTGPAPAAATARDVVAMSAPAPTAACTVAQVGTGYEATVTWSGFSVTSLTLLDASGPVLQSQFGHPIRNGNMTFTVSSAPTTAN